MIKYPKYKWNEDLRRRVSRVQAFLIFILGHMGFSSFIIAKWFELPEGTVRYWFNRNKNKARVRQLYWEKKRKGVLKKKKFHIIKKCIKRKTRLYPIFNKWRNQFNRQYDKMYKKTRKKCYKRWLKKNPNYHKKWRLRRREKC